MSPDAPAPADTTPSPETPADSAEPEDGPVDPAALGDDEQAWRAAFADARAEVERTRNRLELLQLELSDLNNQLLTRSDIYNREYQIQPLITAKEGEIREAQRALGDANQAVEALSTTLQRADLPLGWAR
jgi:chromosome segregation ATPase